MPIDITVAADAVQAADEHTDRPAFAAGPPTEQFDGRELWATLTGARWPTLDAMRNQSDPAQPSTAPRAAAIINRHGKAGIILGFGYCIAPVDRAYIIGPYDPAQWAEAMTPHAITYTNGGR